MTGRVAVSAMTAEAARQPRLVQDMLDRLERKRGEPSDFVIMAVPRGDSFHVATGLVNQHFTEGWQEA